jgi:hypothetical protein
VRWSWQTCVAVGLLGACSGEIGEPDPGEVNDDVAAPDAAAPAPAADAAPAETPVVDAAPIEPPPCVEGDDDLLIAGRCYSLFNQARCWADA